MMKVEMDGNVIRLMASSDKLLPHYTNKRSRTHIPFQELDVRGQNAHLQSFLSQKCQRVVCF